VTGDVLLTRFQRREDVIIESRPWTAALQASSICSPTER